MSHRSAAKNKAAYKERAAAKREEQRREEQRAAARRRRRVAYRWTAIGVAGALVVGLGVGGVVHAQHAAARAAATGPKNMLSDGVLFEGDGTNITTEPTAAIPPDGKPTASVVDPTSGVVDFVVYVDYRDPKAAAFWNADAASLKSWVSQQHVTLEIHPVALLDGTSVATPSPAPSPSDAPSPAASPSGAPSPAPTSTLAPGTALTGDYSLRAAGALACVANDDPDAAYDVNAALLSAQPSLDADGLSNAELVTLVRKAGATSGSVKSCIEHGDFTDWAAQSTARAKASVPFGAAQPVSPTNLPLIVVGGQPYTGDPGDSTGLMTLLAQVYTAEQEAAQAASGTDGSTDGSTQDPAGDAATPQDPAADPADAPAASAGS